MCRRSLGAATESSEQVRCSQRQIFLVSIESSAVLRCEHSADGGRFDRAEKKAMPGLVEAIRSGHASKEQAGQAAESPVVPRQLISRRASPMKALTQQLCLR